MKVTSNIGGSALEFVAVSPRKRIFALNGAQ
jgi:hypothetical protein